jgi:putative addiction module component (TIGR02574 family)
MTSKAKKLLDEALQFPRRERKALGGRLFDKLEIDSPGAAGSWLAEIERRIAEMDSDPDIPLPWSLLREAIFEGGSLHFAAQDGNLAAVQGLLDRGYPINFFDECGNTPLHYAVLGKHITVVDFLLRKGADVNARHEPSNGYTPLDGAASTCSLQMARLLVASGADPTVRSWMNLNALDRAKRRRHSEGTGSVGQAVYDYLREVVRKKKF